MKIVFDGQKDNDICEIIVKCYQTRLEIMRLLSVYNKQDMLIACINNETHRLHPSELYCIEAVNKSIFLCGEDMVYKSKNKLYELETILHTHDFIRVAKSRIINLSKLKSYVSVSNARIEAILTNGKRVIISRKYVDDFKTRIGAK
ncbi:MAG: LytTR family transcriptional regulator [Defluviitaleaceae bacterium]|nr:LytTR family transcriptional regulator [Defluviitaleaceae bacterium]